MKTFLSLCMALVFFALGCGKSSSQKTQTTNTASDGSVITAPVDYLGALAKAKKSTEKTVDTIALNQAIQMFEVQEGRFPKDLNEMVEKKVIRVIPQAPIGSKIEYDAVSGTVKVVKQ